MIDIILDTNIFRDDFLLKSGRFKVLFDYIKKTNSKIILPKIVYNELEALYKRELIDNNSRFKNARSVLGRMLINNNIPDYIIEIDAQVNAYLKYVKEVLNVSDKDIVGYKDSYLEEVVRRASYRIKPCTDRGEETRDVLVWLTILDVAAIKSDQMLVFISKNIKEFALDENLHPDLLKECNDRNVKIKYYNSLQKFVEDHASKIDYITPEWIKTSLDFNSINDRILTVLGFSEDCDRLLE